MSETFKTWTIKGLGSGSRDYTGEIWTGKTAPGIELAYNQEFRLASLVCSGELSAWSHVKALLPPGDTYHFVELADGSDLPSGVEVGHTLFTFSFTWDLSEKARFRIVIDGQLYMSSIIETLMLAYGFSNYFIGTDLTDPTGITAHTIDMTITNLGDEPLEGWIAFLGVYTHLTSPISPTKIVRCKWCGSTKKVSVDTSIVKCNVCRKETWYLAGRKPINRSKITRR